MHFNSMVSYLKFHCYVIKSSSSLTFYDNWNIFWKLDYDGDGFIGKDDLKKTLIALTKNRLTLDEVHVVIGKVINEADNDCDGQISFQEFKHVLSRSPEFMSNFRLRI